MLSPLSFITVFVVGATNPAIRMLGPVFGQDSGFTQLQIGIFLSLASERNIPICNCVNPLSCPNTGPNILIAGLVAPTTKTVIKLSGDSTKVFDRFNEGEFGTVGGMFVVNARGKIHKHKRSEIVL